MSAKHLTVSQDPFGIATITLDKAESHNSFDKDLIAGLTAAAEKAARDPSVRVVVLAANGKSFSAGADLNWMQEMASYSPQQNMADAQQLARLMQTLNYMPKPLVARVQGNAFGGGVGLIACCDIAVGVYDANFALSEVRLGLIPAVISPYVIGAIGERQARRYFLTGERFNAEEAQRIGLLHHLCYADELNGAVEKIVDALLECGPIAQAECKKLIRDVSGGTDYTELTARKIAEIRASQEGREGVSAFLEKRAPNWLRKRAKSA